MHQDSNGPTVIVKCSFPKDAIPISTMRRCAFHPWYQPVRPDLSYASVTPSITMIHINTFCASLRPLCTPHIASPLPRLVQRYRDNTSRRFAGDISREWLWPLIWASVEIMTFRKFRCGRVSGGRFGRGGWHVLGILCLGLRRLLRVRGRWFRRRG